MGDRCDLRITMKQSDIVRFGKAVGYDDWWCEAETADGDYLEDPLAPVETDADGLPRDVPIVLSVEEVNYAWSDELREAAAAGIPFYGDHGSGDEYGPGEFASDGSGYDEIEVTRDGQAFVVYNLDTLKPEHPKRDLENLRRFRDLRKRAFEKVDAAGKKGD